MTSSVRIGTGRKPCEKRPPSESEVGVKRKPLPSGRGGKGGGEGAFGAGHRVQGLGAGQGEPSHPTPRPPTLQAQRGRVSRGERAKEHRQSRKGLLSPCKQNASLCKQNASRYESGMRANASRRKQNASRYATAKGRGRGAEGGRKKQRGQGGKPKAQKSLGAKTTTQHKTTTDNRQGFTFCAFWLPPLPPLLSPSPCPLGFCLFRLHRLASACACLH